MLFHSFAVETKNAASIADMFRVFQNRMDATGADVECTERQDKQQGVSLWKEAVNTIQAPFKMLGTKFKP